eukprot:403728_1
MENYTSYKGWKCVITAICLTTSLVFIYRDKIDNEQQFWTLKVILRFFVFSLSITSPYYYCDIKMNSFSEYILSYVLISYSPLHNKILFYFQMFLYLCVFLIEQALTLNENILPHIKINLITEDEQISYYEYLQAILSEIDISNSSYLVKQMAILILFFVAVKLVLQYFCIVAQNSPNMNRNGTHNIYDRHIQRFKDQKIISWILLVFFILMVLETYGTDYIETMKYVNEKQLSNKDTFLYLTFEVFSGDSWRDIIVPFLVYYKVIIILIISVFANYFVMNLKLLNVYLVNLLNGIFIYFFASCGHRILTVILLLLMIVEINKFDHYLESNIKPVFNATHWKTNPIAAKQRLNSIETLKIKTGLVTPIINKIIGFIILNTLIYFTIDLWILQCTNYYISSENIDKISSTYKQTPRELLIHSIRPMRHFFVLVLNCYLVVEIYKFNIKWPYALIKDFRFNEIRIWIQTYCKETDLYEKKNQNKNDSDSEAKILNKLKLFDIEYNKWDKYFEKSNLLKTFHFKIFGILPE